MPNNIGAQLKNQLAKMRGRRLLVVGDVGVDEYVMGAVKRISPEAPVPVVEVESEDVRLGLAANVAQNITALKGHVELVSVVGDDERSKSVRDLLGRQNVSSENLVIDSTRPTTRKVRVMSGQHHIVRVDYEKKKPLASHIENELLNRSQRALETCDAVIIQDYSKGVLSEKGIQSIIHAAKSKNRLVLVDPYRSTPVKYYRGADLLTPNLDEAIQLSGRTSDDVPFLSESLEEIGSDLMSAIGSDKMIITRSKDGVSLFEKKHTERIPTFARHVYDVTGAGDTFIAAIALAWASGLSLHDACLIANYAAGVVVGKVGVATCSYDELEKLL